MAIRCLIAGSGALDPRVRLDRAPIRLAVVVQEFGVLLEIVQGDEDQMRFIVKYKQPGSQIWSLSAMVDQASKSPGVRGRIDAPLLVRPVEVVHVATELLRFVELFTFLGCEHVNVC